MLEMRCDRCGQTEQDIPKSDLIPAFVVFELEDGEVGKLCRCCLAEFLKEARDGKGKAKGKA